MKSRWLVRHVVKWKRPSQLSYKEQDVQNASVLLAWLERRRKHRHTILLAQNRIIFCALLLCCCDTRCMVHSLTCVDDFRFDLASSCGGYAFVSVVRML